jgi:hypothetical protein
VAKRQYKDEYLDTGFRFIAEREIVKAQCVICGEVLSTESLKQNKLKRHLEAKHSTFVGKGRSFFERREQQMKRQ